MLAILQRAFPLYYAVPLNPGPRLGDKIPKPLLSISGIDEIQSFCTNFGGKTDLNSLISFKFRVNPAIPPVEVIVQQSRGAHAIPGQHREAGESS